MTDAVEATRGVATPEAHPRRVRLRRLALPGAIVGLLLLVAASLAIGVYDVTQDDVGAALFGITRIPRTIALLLSGCAMAACGLVMQMLTQNRFVDATTAGTTEWAALGLLVTVLLWPESTLAMRMVTASATAFLGTLVFMAVLRRVMDRSTLVVPIVGIMLGAVVSAVTTFLAVSTNALQLISTWFTGSFTSIVRGRYEVLWVVLVVLVVVFVVADRLTAAGLGKDVATTLGIRYDHVILLGTALVAIAAAVTTVVVGFLPFLGIIVPNLVSMVRGDDLRGNLPWVCVVGAALVILCDIVGRTIVMPFEVPVALVLGVLGAAVFITLLLRTSRG